MAIINPKGRVNYEPNSRAGAEAGPREDPDSGFQSSPAEEVGPKVRARPASFADHYSQARQFYISQTPIEQTHIADAFTFELSKVQNPKIRQRMVSHLLNVDDELAEKVAEGLGLRQMPKPAEAAKSTRTDLEPSSALSILHNGPLTFEGRKVGALITDGVDSALLNDFRKALVKEGATLDFVAPTIAGVKSSDGTLIEANQKIDGGPSVLYDAVALLLTKQGYEQLVGIPAARDFVADAFAHSKFIAYSSAAKQLLLDVIGVDQLDDGCIELSESENAAEFAYQCRQLRFWERSTSS